MLDNVNSPRLGSFDAWMKRNGLNSRQVALTAKVPYTTVNSFTRGQTQSMNTTAERKIAEAFDTSVENIFVKGGMDDHARKTVPVLGYIAANGEQHNFTEYGQGEGEHLSAMMQGVAGAMIIKGKSMWPRYRDGQTIFVGEKYEDPARWVGHDVAAQIKGDGRITLKTLKIGSLPGYWNLESVNPAFDEIENVELDWIEPVLWVKV